MAESQLILLVKSRSLEFIRGFICIINEITIAPNDEYGLNEVYNPFIDIILYI